MYNSCHIPLNDRCPIKKNDHIRHAHFWYHIQHFICWIGYSYELWDYEETCHQHDLDSITILNCTFHTRYCGPLWFRHITTNFDQCNFSWPMPCLFYIQFWEPHHTAYHSNMGYPNKKSNQIRIVYPKINTWLFRFSTWW